MAAVDHLLVTDDDLDSDRVYVTGFSLGGLGTWTFASCFPDRLAAIVPVGCKANGNEIHKKVNLPIWGVAGSRDRQRANSLSWMYHELRNMGSTSVHVTIYPGVRHQGTAHRAWGTPGLVDWLFSQSLQARTNITFEPDENRSPVPDAGACDWGLDNAGIIASCRECNLYYDGRGGDNNYLNWCEYVPSQKKCFHHTYAKSQGWATETDCPDDNEESIQ